MTRRLILLVIAAVVVVGAAFSIVVLDEREQAFRTLLDEAEFDVFGLPLNVAELTEPGWYIAIPGLHQLHRYERRLLRYDADSSELYTSEKLLIEVDYYAMWRIEDPRLFFESVRDRPRARRRLDEVTFNKVRENLSQKNLADLLSPRRKDLMAAIAKSCDESLSPLGIRVVDLRFRAIHYPQANVDRIFARMRSERDRSSKRFRAEGEEQARVIRAEADLKSQVLRAEAQRDSERIRGEGDADAARIYAEAYGQDAEFYAFVRSLEAYRLALDDQTTLILSPSSPFLKYLFQDGRPATP